MADETNLSYNSTLRTKEQTTPEPPSENGRQKKYQGTEEEAGGGEHITKTCLYMFDPP